METSVTFNNNSFSLRCGKCADIHTAQLDGKTTDSCKCDCHNTNYCPPYNIPYHDPCCPIIPSPIWCGTPVVTCESHKVRNDIDYYFDFNNFATRNLKANINEL